MAAARSKVDPIDATAEEVVRLLGVAPLFKSPATAEKMFAHIVRCEKFVEKETVDDADAVFVRMALEISAELIQYAATLPLLQKATEWVRANGLVTQTENALPVLAVFTLIYIVNQGASRHPEDELWARIKARVQKLKAQRRAA